MSKYRVTMVCKEISRAVVEIEHESVDHEEIKDAAWMLFDEISKGNLEQENYTKVEKIEE